MENAFRIQTNIIGLIIVSIILFLYKKHVKTKNLENKLFLILVYLVTIELSLDSVFWATDCKRFAGDRAVNILVNTFYYIIQMVNCYVWMVYCEIHMQIKCSSLRRIIFAIPSAIGIALIIVNIWTGCVFSVDNYNVYMRTWGFWGGLEAACCMMYPSYCCILVVIKLFTADKKKRMAGFYLLLVSVIPITGSIIQMNYYGLNFIWIGMALALLLVLVEIEVNEYQRIQNELIEQKIKIMLSQIQPHFLFNSLSAIEYLCDENPKKAKEAVVSFAKYLRGNLDSLKQNVPIEFEKELKHTQVYLSLEKMRFEDELNIVYNIQTIDFLIPSLTIQPLVENAVKYGVGQKENGGTVRIETEEKTDSYEIIIEDDGVGFEPNNKQYDGRTHIGIENVRSRLETMSNGKLEIESRKDQGTKVTVVIPKEKYEHISSR